MEEARRYTKAHNVSNKVKLIEGNYSALPLDGDSLDAVFTMEALLHADPLESALSEFYRVLKPGGKLVLFEYSVPYYESLDLMHRKVTDTIVRNTGMSSLRRFTPGSFPALLEAAKFENVTVEDISRNVWPTWRWLFWRAIQNWPKILLKILSGRLLKDTNLAGSLFIWPYRRHIGYNIVTATKPG